MAVNNGGLVLAGLLIPVGMAVLVGLIILVAAAVSAGRAEADPTGERSRAIFLGLSAWLSLFIALFGTFAVVVALTGYIHSGNDMRFEPVTNFPPQGLQSGQISRGTATYGPGTSVPLQALPPNHVVSNALGGGLVALAAGAVLFLYGRRLLALIGDSGLRQGPAGPAIRVYLLATAFAAVFIAVGAGASALFGIYRAVAPGVAGIGSGAHGPGVRQLLDSAYLAAGALVIFRFHHRAAFPSPPPALPQPSL
jgi:hypothetical protein